jgi:hypothetical protein
MPYTYDDPRILAAANFLTREGGWVLYGADAYRMAADVARALDAYDRDAREVSA